MITATTLLGAILGYYIYGTLGAAIGAAAGYVITAALGIRLWFVADETKSDQFNQIHGELQSVRSEIEGLRSDLSNVVAPKRY